MATAPTLDTGADEETIHRVLFVADRVHVYTIPPLTSTKEGPAAASWTTDPRRHIFTARARLIETSARGAPITAALRLEDPATGELFAAAPYTAAAAVVAASDSARFFAVRVVGDGGRRATLGIGFEERGDALDLGLALAEAAKAMGWGGGATGAGPRGAAGSSSSTAKAAGGAPPRRDWGLKEGETLTVDLKGLRRRSGEGSSSSGGATALVTDGGLLPPPPPPAGAPVGGGLLPPPPNAREVRAERRRSREVPFVSGEETRKQSLEALGFDDGEFGEFV